MKKVIVVLAALALVACSTYRNVVATQGAEAADAALETAEWTLCNAAPVGAVERRYQTEALKEAYKTICRRNP